ncbi:MAG: membrane protein insertase YidC [Puniceicoccales bacterium]|jgi:YidC/Oxa1 family membrane protein insertase|nr:membrane protein insertase YidC [Puniceicoccales bacterium]
MDKKNKIIGIILLLTAIGLYAWDTYQKAEYAKKHPAPQVATAPAQPAQITPSTSAAPTAPTPAPAVAPTGTDADASTGNLAPVEAQIITLENDTIRLNITTLGGGIQTVALKEQADTLANRKTPAENPYLFNADGTVPALALSIDNAANRVPIEWAPPFTVVENVPGKRVVLSAKMAGGLTVIRSYELAEDKTDPHVISFKTTFRAGVSDVVPAMNVRLNTGTLPPSIGDSTHQFLGIATYDGSNFHKTGVADFNASSGFLGMGGHAAKPYAFIPRGENQWQWVSVTNQFFAGIIRFDEATRAQVSDLYIHPAMTHLEPGQVVPTVTSITGEVGFRIGELSNGQESTIAATYFVGPREYTRLANLGGDQEKAVQFGRLFWFVSVDFLCKIFVVILNGLHSILPESPWAWGFAIIFLTVIIKAITWPLVTTQQRSAERMRQFQGPMKEIREKYKDDPKRQQQEMMKLYQEHKINPFAGCFPVLIQIPIFTGLFFTFQTLAQLRFQSFLWIPDLSMPDVIPGLETIGGFPIHILPVFMGATMLLNMRLTPMPNVEGQQKMIFYGMMVMFPIICYKMPSALMLYYSVQNCLTIVQTLITRRKMRRETAAAPNTIVNAETTTRKDKKKKRDKSRGR